MSPGEGAWRVSFPPALVNRLRTWAERARLRGLADEYRDTLRSLHQHLSTNPLTFGDPLYRLHHLGLVVCHRVVSGMRIRFAVDEPRHLVYVLGLALMPRHPLADDPPA